MAAGKTYDCIATTTLSSAQASVTFSSISGNYTDLILVCNGYLATADGSIPRIQFNSDTGSNYSMTNLSGNGASATSNRRTSLTSAVLGEIAGWDTTSTEPGMNIAHIMNYSNSTTYKTVLARQGVTTATYPGTDAVVSLWRSTAAITSMDINLGGGTFASGSTFTLYGIAAA